MAQVKTVIDGKATEVQRDRWALDVAREMGISIPTLCNHPALEPYGACRLCVVEVTQGKWTWLTTSCDLPIREGLSIRTDSPAVLKARKMALELLWTEVPEADDIQALARQHGLEKPRFGSRGDGGKCILCGLCTRTCKKILGQSAICFINRGAARAVGTPFQEPSETCIGCQACVAVCPTGHIRSVADGTLRRMESLNTELELARCQVCDQPFASVKELEFIRTKLPEHVVREAICPSCRRQQTVNRLSKVPALSRRSKSS